MMGRNGAGARASALARGGALLVGLICLGTTGALEASRALSAHRYDGLAARHEEESSGALNDEQPAVSYAAWLTVEGTPIDLPVSAVVDGMPSDFYLSHDLWGNRSALGCPYLDERCSEDGMHILVYGHRIGWTDEVFTPLATSSDSTRSVRRAGNRPMLQPRYSTRSVPSASPHPLRPSSASVSTTSMTCALGSTVSQRRRMHGSRTGRSASRERGACSRSSPARRRTATAPRAPWSYSLQIPRRAHGKQRRCRFGKPA